MLKKIVLILCLMFLPVTMAEAYPNEPTGYALLYWGETINQVQQQYRTGFLQNTKRGSTYSVYIPNANGELGMRGSVLLSCHFDNDLGLNSITIPIPRESNQIASSFRNIVRNIAAVCGEPSYLNNGRALWRGDSTFLGVMVGPGVIMIDINRVKY